MDAVGEHRLKERRALPLLRAERVAGARRGQPRYGADRSGLCRVRQLKLFSGVEADLMNFFFNDPVLRRDLHDAAGTELSARDTQPCEPRPLCVAADLIYPRAESVERRFYRRIKRKRIEKLLHAVQPERRAKEAWEQLFLRNQAAGLLRRDRTGGEKAFEGRFALCGGLLHPLIAGKIYALRREKGAELLHARSTVHAGKIGLIDK